MQFATLLVMRETTNSPRGTPRSAMSASSLGRKACQAEVSGSWGWQSGQPQRSTSLSPAKHGADKVLLNNFLTILSQPNSPSLTWHAKLGKDIEDVVDAHHAIAVDISYAGGCATEIAEGHEIGRAHV